MYAIYRVKLANQDVYWSSPGLTLKQAYQSLTNVLARRPGLRLVVVDDKGTVVWPQPKKENKDGRKAHAPG